VRLPTGNRGFKDDPLLKVGVALMTLAIALTVAAVVAIVALRSEPERAIASEPASENAAESPVEPLVRSYPPVEPRMGEAKPQPEPEPSRAEPRPERETRPGPKPEQETLPVAEADWPAPTDEEIEAASQPRHYDLPPGAILGLTIETIGIYNAPVFDSDSQWALDNGIVHVPETSLPWSRTPQRNVYLAGHRLGWRGTESYLVFYNLDKLRSGDEILLKDRDGKRYRYQVTEAFVAGPQDSWVMGQVRGRDMVTLQTCTPIPVFDKRLIVRADRV
jgi:sortase A